MTMPGPGPFPGIPSTLTPNPFSKWLDAAKARGVDEPRLLAAAMTYEAIECAKAIGVSFVTPDKLSFASVVEIARLIIDTENALTIEEEPVGE